MQQLDRAKIFPSLIFFLFGPSQYGQRYGQVNSMASEVLRRVLHGDGEFLACRAKHIVVSHYVAQGVDELDQAKLRPLKNQVTKP